MRTKKLNAAECNTEPFRDEKAANKGRRDKYKFKMTRTIPDNNSLREDNA